jgi:molybdate transport system substrate-binding protein
VFERKETGPAAGRDGKAPDRGVRKPSRAGTLAAGLAALSVLVACGSSGTGASSNGQVKGTVTVFAATSLTSAFNTIGTQFDKAHPGVSVKFNYNGSSSLATSIKQGAPADVFASADTTKSFINYVSGSAGQKVLTSYGFLPATS